MHQSSPAGRVAGRSFLRSPLRKARPTIQARNGSQFPNETPRGNCDPEFELETGYGFPNRPLAETTSRNPRSDRDAFSRSPLCGKMHSTLKSKTGTHLPDRASKSKLRWNSSCFSAYAAQTGTIPPQLRFGRRCATESCHLDKYACGFFKDALNAAEYLGKEMPARYYAARIETVAIRRPRAKQRIAGRVCAAAWQQI